MSSYWRKKTVTPDDTISYLNAREALEDLGYKYIGYEEVYVPTNEDWDVYECFEIYEKDNKQYVFAGMDNFNTTIYQIYLRQI
ncbi:hypothetical protein [Dethiothermospora halolimnae]|uniref:hypothetical protein n=1 Tax=Dethiothermospora halolimnae TaxID=3114390 RepID=UPI003CCC39B4